MDSTNPAESTADPCEGGQVEKADNESCRTRRRRRSNRPSSPASATRGQTEPLAALVAVTAVCLALSLYSGFLTGLVADLGSDREVGEVTAERIWHDVSEDGVFDATTTDLQEDLRKETLPRGQYVAITVTYVGDDGHLESADDGAFGPDRDSLGEVVPSETAERFERPVGVRLGPGDVRPGTFEVVVWG